jgi:NDP-4-keto-2,6-dideoxyhexose 3-C-methyltransferase
MKCRNCKSLKLKKIIKIGHQPISSKTFKKKIKLRKYYLDLFKCEACDLVQLSKAAPANDMYGSGYGYWTGLSQLMVAHMKKKIEKLNKLKKDSYILDIGCSDPTFLDLIKKKNQKLNLFAVDPSSEKFKNTFEKKGINLIVDYFSKKKIDNYMNNAHLVKKKFSLITSFAMFYDIEDPNSFCRDVYNLLEENGTWIVEFSYFPLLLKNLTFDQINHEHVTYYTLTTLNNILKKNGLHINDVNFNEINGGSAEVIVTKKNSKRKVNRDKIHKIFNEEKKINENSYKKFNLRLQNVSKVVNHFINEKKNKIIGYGASTKGNIILNYCKLNNKKLKYIADGNSQKWHRFTPLSNIKIISKTKMRKLKPDYLFVLIWSFRSEVIKQEKKFLLKGGKLVFPLPIFHIVDKDNYKYFMNEKLGAFGFDI